MAGRGRPATAVAVAGGRILAVGGDAEVRACCTGRTEVVELDGRALLPGFIDTHMHLEKIAREMAMLQLDGVTSLPELLELLAARARATPAQEWLRSFGDDGAWHERQLREERLPTREELDRAAPEHAVFLYRGPDAAVLNSAAATALARELADTEARPAGISTAPRSARERYASASCS
jgi:predicted amidohydrolase YtcJ